MSFHTSPLCIRLAKDISLVDRSEASCRHHHHGRRAIMNRIWRGIAVFAFGGVLGTGFGVALGFFSFPYVFPPPVAAEQLRSEERRVGKEGRRRRLPGRY